MGQITSFVHNAGALFSSLFLQPNWHNILDVALMAVIIYYLMKLLVHTHASAVFKGIGIVLIISWLADFLQLNTISWLVQQILSIGILALVIMFQPELRRALAQIGRSRLSRRVFLSTRKQITNASENYVSEIVKALNNMSRKRIGALIVFERQTGLQEVIESGTRIDGEISAPLIENIFEPNTPLHDGAVIIRDTRVLAAACILPLSDNHSISRELGTRHRAAIGMTETADAIALIVSEETGIISMARDGKLTRYLEPKSLSILLTEFFSPDVLRPSMFATWQERITSKRTKQKEDSHEKE